MSGHEISVVGCVQYFIKLNRFQTLIKRKINRKWSALELYKDKYFLKIIVVYMCIWTLGQYEYYFILGSLKIFENHIIIELELSF